MSGIYVLSEEHIYTTDDGSCLRVIGFLDDGQRVSLILKNARDYVDVRLPDGARADCRETLDACREVLRSLEQCVQKQWPRNLPRLGNKNAISDKLEILSNMRTIMDFGTSKELFLRVRVRETLILPTVERLLRHPLPLPPKFGSKPPPCVISGKALARYFFPTVSSVRPSESNMGFELELFNGSSIDFKMKLNHEYGLQPCGWVRIPGHAVRSEVPKYASKDIPEYVVDARRRFRFERIADKPLPAQHIKCAGFDIECLSTDGHMPSHTRDPIITITICAHNLDEMGIRNVKGVGLRTSPEGDTMSRYALQLGAIDEADAEVMDDTPCRIFKEQGADAVRCELFTFPFEDSQPGSRDRAETRLLRKLVQLFRQISPSILYSFNGNGFDIPYILGRCAALGHMDPELLQDFRDSLSLGGDREGLQYLVLPMQKSFVQANAEHRWIGSGKALSPDTLNYLEKVVSTRALGSQTRKNVVLPGIVNFDLLLWWRVSMQEPSYKLDSLARKYVGAAKLDMPYHMIPIKFRTHEGRCSLVKYCLMDTVLTMYLASVKLCAMFFMSMSAVQCVDIRDKFQQGQQYCCMSMLLGLILELEREGEVRYALPTEGFKRREEVRDHFTDESEEAEVRENKKANEASYEGATVLEPKPGLYESPVACLDFASLYPTIMREHNLCFSTFMREPPPEGWKCARLVLRDGLELWDIDENRDKVEHDYTEIKVGEDEVVHFVGPKHRNGLIPILAKRLTDERSEVRRTLKREEKKPQAERNHMGELELDQRQLALKYSNNSLYGAAGASVGCMPHNQAVARAVTAQGRQSIDMVKSAVETHFLSDGKRIYHTDEDRPQDAFHLSVLYGDTDSVFILFDKMTQDGSNVAATRIAEYCTKRFPNPMDLELEKISIITLFQVKKKRYAMYINGKIEYKGLSLKRRDNFEFRKNLELKLLNIMLDPKLTSLERKSQSEAHVCKQLSDLARGIVPIEDLLINKSLTKSLADYGSNSTLAHIRAAQHYVSETGKALEATDRFNVLYVGFEDDYDKRVAGKRTAGDRARHLELVLRDNHQPHLAKYLDLCQNTVCALMCLFYKDQERKKVGKQGTLFSSAVVGPEQAKTLKDAKAIGMTSDAFYKGFGFETAMKRFFHNLQPVMLAVPRNQLLLNRAGCYLCKQSPCACTPVTRKRKWDETQSEIHEIFQPYAPETWHGNPHEHLSSIPLDDKESVCRLNRARNTLLRFTANERALFSNA